MKRYLHNKSNYHLITSRIGELTPIGGFEVLAGDTVQIQNSGMIRVSPPATPVMHPITVKFYNFFVPNRILNPKDLSFEWEKFITGGEDGLYVTPPPRATATAVAVGDVMESFGIMPGTRDYNTFLPKGYAKIFNDYFRDQQIIPEIDVDTYDGNEPPFKVAWARDYFTSCRESDLLGPEVTLPLGNRAPVGTDATTNNPVAINDPSGNPVNMATAGGSGDNVVIGASALPDNDRLYADLSAAGAINVNDLREAMALQRYQEARNMYGARFTEYLRYLGISSSDGRLQRPELISSGSSTINFSEVLQTTDAFATSDNNSPLGTLGGHGVAGVRSKRARYFCEEQGHVISLMAVRPKGIYTTTQHKMFDRFSKEDYWQKELQAIGMEEVLNKELDITHSDPDGVFGYNNRYESFKQVPSRVSGEFRLSLNSWHLAREAAELGIDPQLDKQFLECNPSDRIYWDTATDSDKLWCTIRNRVAVRSMLRKSTQNFIL
nr:MAG: major capsid protein [Microvirus sp.]